MSYGGRGGRGSRGKGGRPKQPRPVGEMCSPTCPFFRCSQNALMYTKKYSHGRMITVVMCRLVGDRCIGYRCQYAYCEKKYLLPDGRCAWALKKKEGESDEDFLRDIKEEEKEVTKIKRVAKDLDDFI